MSARVLVVDDILPNVKILEAKLTSEYYEVLTATRPQEALEKVFNEHPDIVLLDVMMPEMDGFEVCRRIKSNPETSHIPVVMVTALSDSTDRVRGLEAGADDFLSKPVNDLALKARIRSLVRLKMTMDEWRVRERTASTLGVLDEYKSFIEQSATKARVLLIEDQSYEAEKISETLRRDSDQVYAVQSGHQAMEKTVSDTEGFDLIITSLNLQDEDSLRLCSHLKSSERTRGVPVLMIAEERDMEHIARGLELGANDYMLRPIDRNELLARVRTQIRRKRFNDSLRRIYEQSLSMAITDPLTGLYNRRYLTTHMEKLLEKNRSSGKSMAVLMLDIDHFKPINDTYGHSAGDEVLVEVAKRLMVSVRGLDLVARMGGEEFACILPDISYERALDVAERLRRVVGEKPFTIDVDGTKKDITVTTSIGGSYFDSREEVNGDKALQRADSMLYAAKNSGRDQVIFEEGSGDQSRRLATQE